MSPLEIEQLTDAATIVVAVAAVYALKVAIAQMSVSRENTKASFLMELDTRWEGADMREARSKWGTIRDGIETDISRSQPNLTGDALTRRKLARCIEVMEDLFEEDPDGHSEIIKIIGFFETLGYMKTKGYISAHELADLYGESIIEFDNLFREYLEKRIDAANSDMDGKSKLFEHTIDLIEETHRFYNLTRR